MPQAVAPAPAHADPAPSFPDLRAAVDRRLGTLAPGSAEGDGLGGVMRYALLERGKRVRPLLALLACGELGGDWRAALDLACAVEMVHAASLLLDDLPCMDDAPLRRGLPCAHLRFGESAALLASVSLLALAFGTAASADRLDAQGRTLACAALARAAGHPGLAGGQHAELTRPPATAAEAIAGADRRKTGALFEAAAEVGALAAGADMAGRERLRAVARDVGQGFQIRDDLEDAEEDRGRPTLVAAIGRDEARRRLLGHRLSALGRLRGGGGLATFVSILLDGGSVGTDRTSRQAAAG